MRKPANRIAKNTAKQTVFFFTFIPSFSTYSAWPQPVPQTSPCVFRYGSALSPEHHPPCGIPGANPAEYGILCAGPNPLSAHEFRFLIGVNLLETTSRCLRTCPRHRLSCFKNCLANTALIRSGLFAVMNYFATLVRTRARLRRAWASSSSRASRFFWAKVASARALLASARALSIWSAHSKVVASK